MTSGGGRQPNGGWLDRPLNDSSRPRKRELALAIRSLCRILRAEDPAKSGEGPPSQAEVAKRLHSNATSLSRFVSPHHPRVPNPRFLEDLHKAASADAAASGQEVGLSLAALQALRASADGEKRGCKGCVELGVRIDSLTHQLSAPCPACTAYQQEREENAAQLAARKGEVTTLRAAIQAMQTTEADLRASLAMAKASRTPLPVPHRQRDRQRSKKEVAVARQLAAQAGDLDSAGKQDAALTILRQGTTELLSPTETALVIVELRQQERDHLADNLIHVYGRDQEDRHVMAVALKLHEEGAADDAGSVLRAALR
ncbi:hypothetical protein QF034_002966 [Streptomyces africanus]|uniref:Uncharacterized protein n=1 Tax=Streptomyces africanus TaxID=231024 RepID=A0ABU0QP34_9ACTN|nr:hypothetical protein [Streptomyces africanus]MDQ0748735.1 hypothetical protein [Streptomyces africanus]